MESNLLRFNVSLVGGLGNQLFQYAHIRSHHKNDVIGLIFDLGKIDLNRQSESEITNLSIQNFKIVQSPVTDKSILPRIHNGILKFSNAHERYGKLAFLGRLIQNALFTMYKISTRGQVALNYQPCLGYHSNFHPGSKKRNIQVGYFQHCAWKNDQQILQTLMALKLTNPTHVFLEAAKVLKNKKFLAVHLRFGDYSQESKFGIPTKEYFRKAIAQHFLNFNYDEVLIFTNEKIKAMEYLSEFKEMNFRLIDEDAGLTPSENLELMRLASGYVISNSTFSWWGAFLSHTHHPLIICPEPWFSGYKEPRNLIPSEWVRIGMN